MESRKFEIIKKAGEIIMTSGLEALTINNLASKMDVKENKLFSQFTKDDEIFLAILTGFEYELNEIIQQIAKKGESSGTELELLFKMLHSLFLQKPYYLSVIFDKSLLERDNTIKKSFLRIRNIAETYLSSIINKGKEENTFTTKLSTKSLVNKILLNFRLFMKDEQLLNEMLVELTQLRRKLKD
ncbi:MAG: hypothetical protein PF484_06795 [Bacteroidales bacterium]|jgi:AcrR family transcriptional regulator|nr:hypothetical protein [Bacteroidales bacterium]